MSSGKIRVIVTGLLLTCSSTAAQPAETAPLFKLVKTIPLGAGERWDYVTFDAPSNRVYVAHGDEVTVVDAEKDAVIGQIGPLNGGTHGIAVADNNIGYTDDGRAGIAAAFDPKSFKIVRQIPTAPDADGVVFDSASRHVFVINGDSGSITVIDPGAKKAIKTIVIGKGLEAAVVDGRGKLFVDGVEDHDVVAIDTRNNTVLAHYAMPGCERPHGIAIDPDSRRVFATCVNRVMVVIDADRGTNIATLPIGSFSDGAAFDPKRKLALSSNGDGTLSLIQEKDPNHFAPLEDVVTARGARTIAIDPATERIFLPAADVATLEAPSTPGGRPHVTYVPGSLKLLEFSPGSR